MCQPASCQLSMQRGVGRCANQVHLPPVPFARLKARRVAQKAIVAVTASMSTAAFHIIRDRVVYRDLGADHFTKRDPSLAWTSCCSDLTALTRWNFPADWTDDWQNSHCRKSLCSVRPFG